jgi:hypothetical protein
VVGATGFEPARPLLLHDETAWRLESLESHALRLSFVLVGLAPETACALVLWSASFVMHGSSRRRDVEVASALQLIQNSGVVSKYRARRIKVRRQAQRRGPPRSRSVGSGQHSSRQGNSYEPVVTSIRKNLPLAHHEGGDCRSDGCRHFGWGPRATRVFDTRLRRRRHVCAPAVHGRVSARWQSPTRDRALHLG